MPFTEYTKPYRSNADLINHLIGKGLSVASSSDALAFLKKITYYRFKVYLRPYLDVATNQYLRGDFSDGVALYEFDRELRELLFARVARLEVKLRSRLDQVVTEHTGNPFWYLDDLLFPKHARGKVDGLRAKIHGNFQRATDDFVNHFKSTYVNTINFSYKHLPPFWIAAELTTFGNIPILYQALDKSQFATGGRGNKLDDLAREFGARNLTVLNGWLLALRELRNRCAHHNRVWNANYRGPADIPGMLAIASSHPNRIYLLLVLMQVMSRTIGLDADLGEKLSTMLARYPQVVSFFVSMGVPNDWESDPIWY